LSRPRRSSTEAAVLAICLLVPVGVARAAEPAPEALSERARTILQDSRFQKSLPDSRGGRGMGGGFGNPGPQRGGEAGPGSAAPPSRPVRLPVGGLLAPLAEVLAWVLLGVVLVLLGLWIARAIAERQGKKPEPAPEPLPSGSPVRREPPLDAAAALAAQGRYAEAVHVLLLQAIRQLAERTRTVLPPSRTSREIARLLPLRDEVREPFWELVRAVEVSLFGGLPVGPDDYQRSLAHYRTVLGRCE